MSEEALHEEFDNDSLNLEILAEEAAEVQEEIDNHILLSLGVRLSKLSRIKSKIVRFGLNDYHPKNLMDNKIALSTEIGQIKALIKIVEARGIVDTDVVAMAEAGKIEKMPKWYDRKTERGGQVTFNPFSMGD